MGMDAGQARAFRTDQGTQRDRASVQLLARSCFLLRCAADKVLALYAGEQSRRPDLDVQELASADVVLAGDPLDVDTELHILAVVAQRATSESVALSLGRQLARRN